MPGRLQGKVAVVTGGVSGIGLGTVELFVAEGAQVVAADIQDEKGRMLEQRFKGQVRYAHCDVTVEAEIAETVGLAKSEFGGLDVLFNNAGISDMMRTVAEIEPDRWSWIFDVLVRGPALGIKHATPLMLARGGGSIVNTASIAGLQAGWGPIAYSSAKAAVIHMTRCAAAQLSPQRIRVNAICPGLIATSIFGASLGLPREVADQMAARVAENGARVQPVPKAGVPGDIAEAALFLASDASAFVTGTHLVVDGGITVGGRHSWDAAAPSPFFDLFGEAMAPQPAG
jgi:NAD(P)-dependent dehydrogenase (short-subunit alcohol dehydrogenase family)